MDGYQQTTSKSKQARFIVSTVRIALD